MRNRVGPGVRALRRRNAWTQQQLGERAGTSRDTVSRLERGHVDGITIGSADRIVRALDARLIVDITWQGEQLDRLVDADHAALQNAFAAMLRNDGWDARVEVSFNHFGDRGRYDIFARHPPSRSLLVTEIKPRIGDAQDTIGRLGVKRRLALRVASDLGWDAGPVVPALVLGESRTNQRRIAEHAELFAEFAVRGRSARAWIRSPTGRPSGLLLYLPVPTRRITRR